ncbi:hypothetical protein ACFL5E_04165 [Candidatus Omnitrophota bacterium]
MNKIKIVLFYFVVLLPTIFLVVVISNIAFNVYKINSGIDYGRIQSEVKDFLSSERGMASLKEDNGDLILRYEFTDPRRQYDFFERDIGESPSGDERVICVYGSSPVASKLPLFGGKHKNFPELLQIKLNEGESEDIFKVYNLGITSADSYGINEIAEGSLDRMQPDLAIYCYDGGMDYESAFYAAGIKNEFYPLKIASIRKISARLPLKGFGWWRTIFLYMEWFNRTYLQPYLINFLQGIGVLRLDISGLEDVNSLVEDDMEKNVKDLARMTRKRGVPLIFVTCPTNLEAQPFGLYDVTQELYEKGMSQDDHNKRFKYLMMARDTEVFTGDLSAKSSTYEIFRGLDEEGYRDVYVVDLPGELLDGGYSLGYEYFYDYGHMRPAMHELIAERLNDFIKEKNILSKGAR